MTNQSPSTRADLDKALAELAQLRRFDGPPKDFWPRFLAAVQQLTFADKLVLLARKSGQPWRRIMEWPAQTLPSGLMTAFLGKLDEAANRTATAGPLVLPLDGKAGSAAGNHMIAAGLELPQQDECVLAALLSEINEAGAREALMRLRLAGQIPDAYQGALANRQAKADIEKLASVLDLTASVGAEKRFLATALAFCNGLATRFNCDRVSLGWLEHGYVRLRAMSRTERFDRQMAAAQALEAAMEEALDQNEEVVWPPPEGASVICRDHERFAKDRKIGQICSAPLRHENRPVAVVTCERQAAPFSETELQQLRLSGDLAAPRLADLHRQDRWFGARWAAQAREECAKLIGPEHTWAKLLALLIAAVLAALFFLRVPYRVRGDFVLRSDATAYLAAPFDGYIDQVSARPGDVLSAGSPMLKLKTAELELEESYALADLNRYEREAEKARAAKALAEMRIAQAMAEQAAARLDLIRYRLGQATLKAPFNGVVIEGDLRERLGAPVKTADVLFKVARIDTLYVEAEVNERDVHEILGKTSAQIAFVSQPRHKFPVRIVAVEQAAVAKNEGNFFLVRCAIQQEPQAWWRPGMSGVCRIDAGRRTLLWIATHRTADFLRLKLWW
ncbi:MAG: efflux RND transporter periplasmic adaptor subunit [Verrucomicrobiota bacterium]